MGVQFEVLLLGNSLWNPGRPDVRNLVVVALRPPRARPRRGQRGLVAVVTARLHAHVPAWKHPRVRVAGYSPVLRELRVVSGHSVVELLFFYIFFNNFIYIKKEN